MDLHLFSQVTHSNDLTRGLLLAVTFLVFTAIVTRILTVLILSAYCRGVRAGYIPRWIHHAEAIRRYVAGESLNDLRGPWDTAASYCVGGIPTPRR